MGFLSTGLDLDMGGKSRAPQTDDAGFVDGGADFFRGYG